MILAEAQKQDYKQIKKLYDTAFPKEERAPFSLIKKRAMQGRATMLAVLDDDGFAGFAYTVVYKNLVYLFYFAIIADKRGKGYGTKILQLLKERYDGKNIFIAYEQLDKNADNFDMRVRRHGFYVRNGFNDVPRKIREATVVYDVMSTDGVIDINDYDVLITRWSGKIVKKLVKMQMTATDGVSQNRIF